MPRPMPMAPEADELALARRCASGDVMAQRQLFQQQRALVHRTLYRILGTNRQMEDLVQDTFVAAFASIASFRGESSLATWMATIAARICYRHLSSREPRGAHLQAIGELPAAGADPEHHAVSRQALRSLYALLDRIDPAYRIAYTLHEIDGRSIREVARITRSSSISVKTRLWRARRMVEERARRDPALCELLTRTLGAS